MNGILAEKIKRPAAAPAVQTYIPPRSVTALMTRPNIPYGVATKTAFVLSDHWDLDPTLENDWGM
jgi:hypothetical protein